MVHSGLFKRSLSVSAVWPGQGGGTCRDGEDDHAGHVTQPGQLQRLRRLRTSERLTNPGKR